jgi:hypothetical protein
MIEVDTQVRDDAAVIRSRGRLTMVATPQLRTLINEMVHAGRAASWSTSQAANSPTPPASER